VVDQGIGIPENEQEHMFERLFRASNVTNVQGTGLGLNIVKKYVDLHGGTISFRSEEGKGSTFTVTIPQ
jgi:signal transduction histidine kinase